MPIEDMTPREHSHEFVVTDKGNERRTIIVVVLTMLMMVGEVVGGFIFGSMALLADGWHMATHVAALSIAVFAYRYARRHSQDPRFTFGTGKVGVLAGFGSATGLAVVALMMFGQSAARFFTRPEIHFDEAIFVAAMGLAVNVASAFILGTHSHSSSPDSRHLDHHSDHNLRAAYLHVIADAVTSVLAIMALTAGKFWNQLWLDPLMGLAGGVLIARWSYGLIRDTGRILLDAVAEEKLLQSIRRAVQSQGDATVSDLHVWKVSPHAYAAILSVVTNDPQSPDYYRDMLAGIEGLAHVTVEVQRFCSTDK